MTVLILVLSIVLLAVSGAPALLTRGRAGEHASTALVLLGAIFVTLLAGVAWVVVFPYLGVGK